MYSCLLNIDLLGHKPELFYQKEDRYKTTLGSLLTIVIGLLSILAFIGFGLNLLLRKNPTGVYNKELNEDKNVEVKDLFFLFAPHLPLGLRLEEFSRKFEMRLRYFDTDFISEDRRTNTTIAQTIPLVYCTETERYKNNYLNVTSHMTLNHSDYWCIPDDFTKSISGSQGSSKFSFMGIVMAFCTNTTRNDCYTVTQIQSLHPAVILQVLTLDRYVDPKKYNSPIKPLFTTDLNKLDTKALRNDFIWLKYTEIITDSGWIIESPDTVSTFQISNKQFTYAPGIGTVVLQMDIAMDTLKDVYYRKYQKIQDVLASAGGFIKMILLISQFIIDHLNSRLVYQSIYLGILDKYGQKITSTRSKQSDTVIIFKETRDIRELRDIKKGNVSTELSIIPPQHNSYFADKKQNYNRLSLSDIICSCRKRRQNITSLLMDDVMKHLSVENILVQTKVMNMANKLIWGGSGYKLLKFISIKDFLNGLENENPEEVGSKMYNIETLANDVNHKRVIDTNEILKRELNFPVQLSEMK
jgi:hypothetical protein